MQHLLLLHGAIGAKDQFEPLAEMLKGKFIIHTLNFAGHGGSEMQGDFSIPAFSDAVLKYLTDNKINSIHVFGYSMGGFVALYLAKHHPEKVDKIFTFATKFLWSPEIAQREVKMLDPDVIAKKIPAFAQQLAQRHLPNDWKLVMQKTAQLMLALGNTNLLINSDYESIKHPVLIGIGDQDAMVTLEETVAVFKSLPNAGLIVFPNTPHPIEKINLSRLANEVILFFAPQNLKA